MLFRLGLMAFNIWSAKKTFDLLQENSQLKKRVQERDTTIRTLAGLREGEPRNPKKDLNDPLEESYADNGLHFRG